MSVDFEKPPLVLVVHGVQLGDDSDLKQHKALGALLTNRLAGIPFEFSTDIYKYEGLNDARLRALNTVLRLIPANPVAKFAIKEALDIIGDVVINLKNGSTAHAIRRNLIARIEEIHDQETPLYIVAHSLGSIYAFDVVNALMHKARYFDRRSRETWPVQGMVTIGSPIGLQMFRRTAVAKLGDDGTSMFHWRNFWDRTDPVVSGSFYGKPRQGYMIAERFPTDDRRCGWLIRDTVVDIGKPWLFAHVGYWEHPLVGDQILDLISR